MIAGFAVRGLSRGISSPRLLATIPIEGQREDLSLAALQVSLTALEFGVNPWTIQLRRDGHGAIAITY
jgi:hypothetical protein